MPYFIIRNSDGDTRVDQMDKDTLLERIQPEEGEENFCYYGRVEFLNKIEEADPNYWGNKILIIKGEIITPKPKKIREAVEATEQGVAADAPTPSLLDVDCSCAIGGGVVGPHHDPACAWYGVPDEL